MIGLKWCVIQYWAWGRNVKGGGAEGPTKTAMSGLHESGRNHNNGKILNKNPSVYEEQP